MKATEPAPSCFDCIKEYSKIMPQKQSRLAAEIEGQATTNGNIWLCMTHFNKRVAGFKAVEEAADKRIARGN